MYGGCEVGQLVRDHFGKPDSGYQTAPPGGAAVSDARVMDSKR